MHKFDAPYLPSPLVSTPLVKTETPERTVLVARYNTSLLECIHIINHREHDLLKFCLPELLNIASEIAGMLGDSVNDILSRYEDAETYPPCSCPPFNERLSQCPLPTHPVRQAVRYHNTAMRTLQVAALNSSLMFCIKDISRREGDHLKVYLDDLIDIAWDIALTLSACVEDSLGDDNSLPTICSACRGEIPRQH